MKKQLLLGGLLLFVMLMSSGTVLASLNQVEDENRDYRKNDSLNKVEKIVKTQSIEVIEGDNVINYDYEKGIVLNSDNGEIIRVYMKNNGKEEAKLQISIDGTKVFAKSIEIGDAVTWERPSRNAKYKVTIDTGKNGEKLNCFIRARQFNS